MRSIYSKHRAWFFITLTVLILLTAGCNESTAPEETNSPEAPELPPVSTMVIPFGDFTSANPGSDSFTGNGEVGGTLLLSNFQFAAGNIVFWQVVGTITLIVPITAYIESFNHEPVQQPDGSWVWSYSVRIGGILHTAELHARLVSQGIQWEMFLSKENAYSNFLWFSGFSNFLLTEGNWTLNHKPEDPQPFLSIEWNRNPQQGTGDVKYTIILPNNPENGSFIIYGINNQTPYNTFFDVFSVAQNTNTDIEWDRATIEGRVQAPWHFNDSDWHCWDAAQQDITCP